MSWMHRPLRQRNALSQTTGPPPPKRGELDNSGPFESYRRRGGTMDWPAWKATRHDLANLGSKMLAMQRRGESIAGLMAEEVRLMEELKLLLGPRV